MTAYRREALCWPVMTNGSLNTKYRWPLDGELVAGFNLKSANQNAPNSATHRSGMSVGEKDTDKTVRIIAAEHEANSKWVSK